MRFILLFLLISSTAFAQNSLQFHLQDNNKQPLPFSTAILKKLPDSTLYKGFLTDENGLGKINKIPAGNYVLQVQSTGFASKKLSLPSITETSQIDLGIISLSPLTKELAEVEVRATKPLIEKKLDKTIVNVENSAMAAGNTTMEVLERSPGVIVDKDGNISLRGKSGAKVMIDGKIAYLTGTDLANYLRNLPADQISTLEIMTNPSSRYDAAGTGGIINIRLKKNANIGMNGSANATLAQAYFLRQALGANLNYRNNGWNWFGNASVGQRPNMERNYLLRRFTAQQENWEQSFRYANQNKNAQVKGGVDWYYSPKTTFGILLSGGYNYNSLNDGLNQTVQMNSQNEVLSRLDTYNSLENPFFNYAANFNFKHTYDSTGRELTIDLDHARFVDESQNNYRSRYVNALFLPVLPDSLLRTNSASFINQYSLKSDYVIPSFLKAKWSMGMKSSWVQTDNDLQFRSKSAQAAYYNFLTGQSNRFVYTEQIHALYLNTERAIGKWSYQIGLRGEWTLADGTSSAYTGEADMTFHRDYLQIFPSAFLQYEASKKHTLGMNYSRRIDRPGYSDLNPFVFFLDNYTYNVGNPMLMPQLTNSFELSHTYMGGISTTLGYSHTDQVITQLLKQEAETRKTFQTTANMAQRVTYSLGISLPIPIKNWWTSNTDIFINRAELTGNISTANINTAGNMFYVSSNHTFTLPKDYKIEFGGNYFTGGLEGAFLFGAGGSLNMGIQKTIMKKRATIRLNAQDILYTSNPPVTIKYADLDVLVRPKNDSRVVRLNFTYRFGNAAIKGARQRSTGLDSEKGRVKGAN
ncbi:outer membrane beta-barrel family protein [Aquirufa sp. LEPPI-3A]|uniref:outer membrane beta-barrel family protein n=1 Tax=Aquirufa regiilacus TaxID=3024868 RepID=UPI0028DF4C95|nr:outer membrane beta-barrel family protein [Aquirufa sp. LEPPI-3A]MDT8887866.1 outer membrane beta-barrel family protein [Aquirufa sp. LEPPI-3A]